MSVSGWADTPPTRFGEQLFGVTGPQTLSFTGLSANSTYQIFVVAETSGGLLQATPFEIYPFITPPCPPVYLLTGFPLPSVCVNKGTLALFTIELPDTDPFTPGKQTDVNKTGVFAGTTWSLNWGDGTTNTYTSASDNDIPTDINFFTHTYTTAANCVYNVTLTVRNPCGEVSLVTYPIDVHGRDQGDNDGQIIIEDVASGETVEVEVCEGSEHILTMRDISDWNCQDPTFPDGTPAPPNDEPRTIQWVYGEDDGGGIQNTIGTTLGTLAPVIIGGANPATTANGYEQLPVIGPITATGELSQTILIPDDCRAGEYFDVYLRNWNKCNPYPADPPVFTHIRILVVDAPDAPIAPDRTICFGEDRTLEVTSAPTGTLTWYSDAALTTNVGTGATFIPTQTAPGVYTFWVTDQEVGGLNCVSPATEVTLTIREEIDRPGTITGPTGTCPNVNGLTYSVPAVTMTKPIGGAMEYVWSVGTGLTIASGQGTRQITVNVGSTTGNRDINVFLRYATDPRCNSNDRELTLAVYSTTHNPGTIAGSGVCPGSTVNITSTTAASTGTPASSGPTYSWHRSVSPFSSWTALPGTNATFSETMATPGVYRYRRTATFGCGTPVSTTVDVPVYSTSHNAGSITSSDICRGQTVSIANATSASTGTPASSGPIYSWHRATGPGFSTWTALTGSNATFSQTMNTPGVYRYRRTATFGCGTPVTTTVDVTVFSTAHVAGAIDGNDVCPGDPITINSITAASTGTPASSGPTYSWRRAPGPLFTAWTNLTGSAATYSETMATPGTYRYQRRASFGCGSTVSTTTDINVFSTTHNPGSISNTNACAGSSFTIASASDASTGTPASSGPTYSWQRAPGPAFTAWSARPGTGATITETIATPGVYRYRRTATFGCGSPVSTTADVTVYSTTHNAGVISSSPICAGATINILNSTAASTGTPASSGPTYSWHRAVSPFSSWTPLTGSAATFSETMNTPGTYRYRRTATFGCGSPVTTTVDVVVNPLPDPVIAGANNVCQNDEETYTTPSVAGHTYTWSTSLGTIINTSANSVTIRWGTIGNGSVTVTETITATGCNKTTTPFAVTVNPGPPVVAPSFVSGLTNICRNGTLNLDVSNVATAIEYIWDFSWLPGTSDATTATSQISIDLTGIAPGTYSVTVAGSNGCGTGPWMTPAHTFNINDIPDLAPLSNTVCSDAASAITFSISNAGPTITGLTYNIASINMNGLSASAGSPAPGSLLPANIIADDAYTNKTNANVNVIYSVVPVSSQGCLGNAKNVTLIVQPEPVLASLSTSKCSDEALGFNLSVAAGSSPAASYNITSINANGLTASAGSPAPGPSLPASSIADDAWRNTSNAPVNVVYSIVPVGANGCTGDTYTMTITVNPEPILATLNTTKCSDEPLGFSLAVATGSVPAANYNITSINANGLTASAGLPAPGSLLPASSIADDAWTNTTNAPVDVIYTVVPVSAAGCLGDPRTITITVNPEPSLANLSNAVCSDAPSGITLAVAGSSVPAATYNITAINDGGLISSAGTPAVGNGLLAAVISDDAWTNKTNGDVNVVYTVVPVSANGCAGNPVDVTLTVRPEPVLANLNTSVCSDAAFGFNLSLAPGSSPAASYNITAINANGLTASAGSPAPGSLLPASSISDDAWTNTSNAPVNVVYSIVPVGVNGCSGDTYTMTVTINPEPVLVSMNTTRCSDEPLGFSLNTAAGSVAASSYNITAINANGLTASAGSPAPGSLLPASSISDDAWTNTTGAPVDVVYTVVPVSAAGCQGNAQTVTITINPEPGLANLNTTLCSDVPLNFNLATTAGSVAAASYNITSINANGLTASAGSPAPSSLLPASVIADDAWRNTTPVPVNVVYTVVPVSASGCPGNPTTMTITVNPEPVMATPGTTVCSREALGITLAVNAGGVSAAYYNITAINSNGLTPSAGSPAPSPLLPASSLSDDAWINITSANVNVVYTVVPVSADGCEGNPADITIVVKPEPVIIPDQTTGACSGNALDYEIQLLHFTNPAAGVTFTWNAPVLNPVDPAFTGGTARSSASSANITDTFINTLGVVGTATYTVIPYYNGCAGQPVDIVITVGSEPVLDPDLDDFACSNVPIGLVLKEAAGSVTPSHYNIISVNYESGLTPAGTNALIPNATAPATFLSGDIYANLTGVSKTVTYRVQPVLAPDCFGDPVDVVMTIRPQPVIVPGQIKTVCSGVPINYEILLLPANTPAGTIFNWDAPAISNGPAQGTAGVNVAADPDGTLHITDVIDNLTSAPVTATYNIIPTSADGCVGDAVPVIITINQEPLPPAISGRDDLCVGDNPVVYTVPPVGGSSFTWTVDPAVGIKTFDFNTNAIMISAALTPGTGNIMVYETNSLGCSGDPFILPVQVWESPAKEDITGDAVVCAYTTHSYSVTNRVGSTYSWTLPGGAAIIGDPSASSISVMFGNVGGTISVRETNIAGCITNHNPFSVTVNPQPSANISNGGNMCDGGNRPLNVSFIGTAPFQFTYAINGVAAAPISTSDNPYIINATLAGTYTIVNITDATGCTATGTGSTTITYFPKPTGIISGLGELCRGNSATLTMTFTGVAPFTFTYGDGVNPDILVSNHPNNVYTVNVSPLVTSTYALTSLTDFNNCDGVLSGTATINVNQPPSLSLAGTNLICHNVPTGEIDMTIADGTGPFGISWTGPNGFTAPVEDISGLNEGYYAVTVTDAKGCSATANITLSQPQPLNATVDRSNVTCFGADDGTITISGATGGLGIYEYSFDGGLNWQPGGSASGLTPGAYSLLIRDEVNPTCIRTLNPSLQITGPAQLTGTVSKTDITCFGANDGTITITFPSGGYGTYQYSHNGGTDWQDTPVFTGLSDGTYDVRIRDRAFPLCAVILNPAIIITEPAQLAATVGSTNVTCYGANNGTITVSGATGGYGTYEYTVNGGASWQLTGSFINLAPGVYDVRMRDRVNPACSISLDPALQITEPPVLSATVASTNVTCNGAADGTISITNPLGGYGTYQYTIDGGTTWEDNGSFTNLAPGFYNVKIRDAAFITCEITLRPALQVTEPAVLSASVASVNVTCNGADDGRITITNPLGGSGTYVYSIDGGTTWLGSGSFDNLAPGTYDVRIADAANPACVIILNPALVITEPDALSASLQKIDVTCFGANNGIIAISDPAGGYGTYQYSIDGGVSWQFTGNYTNLTPGTYEVRMRDAAHITCEVILDPSLDITQPDALSASLLKTDVTCFGGADGTITITNPTGGYGTYQYSVNGGGAWQSSGSFTGLGQGSYNVQIRDAANPGCVIVLNNALVISQPAILRGTIITTMVTCFGADDGIITITNPLGGYGTYEYSIDGGLNWQGSGTFVNQQPATYDVRMRDALYNGCVVTLNPQLVITEPAELNAVVTTVDITCSGSNNGRITISNPTGGYGTYDYSVDGGATWQPTGMFSNLAPGTYDVRIRDRANPTCIVILPAATITQTDPISADVASTNVTCNGASDGTITISNPLGGTGAYSYTVNGGSSWQTSGTFTGLAPGTYNVRIRDAADITCEIVLDPALVITQPDKLTATVARTNVTCYGANDGTITITNPQGGYGTYGYSIDGGANWQPGGNFTALAPGFYNVMIRDAAHPTCMVTLNGSLRITEPPVLSANVTSMNVTCNGADDGRITISGATGGYGTYLFSINGGTGWQASGLFENLTPGTYDVRIADAANPACVIILNPALVITEPDALAATVTPTMVTCFGANNGIITITNATGGYGSYEYSINGGGVWSGLNTFSNLAPGFYDVRMRDALHQTCEITLDAALEINQPDALSASLLKTDVTCFGSADGTITITNPTGGYGTYEFSINGGGAWQSSGSFTGLGPGYYNVITRDAAHPSCVIVLNNALQITQPAVLNGLITTTMVTCNGANDGIITINNPTGGYGTYEYSNDGGSTWQGSGTFNNLQPATYDVRIRDAVNNACVIILNPSVVITEPVVLSAAVGKTDITCFGANDGRIVISSPSGGYGTYDYSIDGGVNWQPTGAFSNLTPGFYDVRIRDRAHPACVMILDPALEITEPAELTAAVTASMVTCSGANDGRIEITGAAGGYGTYQYTINGGAAWQTSGIFNYLAHGTYDVRIRDAANIACSIILDPALEITQPDKLSATVDGTAVTCFGANDGTITITNPQGGYGTYQYSINGGLDWQADGSFSSLAPGYYNVQIRDAANPLCVVILNGSYRISEPAILAANVSHTNVTCFGADNGTISITSPTGGYGTYQYSIDGGSTWQGSGSFNNLEPGTYDVRISDLANPVCVITLNPALVITEPDELIATVTKTDVTCFGANNGTISITSPSGGYGTYQYSINGTTWQGFGTFSNLAPATYEVSIRDAANPLCVVILDPAMEITEPAQLAAAVGSTDVSCFGGNDGTITITGATGGYGTYEYSINGGGSWNSTGVFTNLTAGAYNILIRDAAHQGCIIVLNNAYIITQPSMLSATVSKTEVSCNGFNDGTITITNPVGGYGTYEYTVNGGASWQSSNVFSNLQPATYDVRIRDEAHPACSVILYPNLLITEPLTLSLSSTGDVVLDCFGDNDGMGTFYAAGGTMPYTFIVDDNTTGGTVAAPGFNSQTFFNAGAGLVRVTVVDVNGCSAQAVINLTQPDDLIPGSIEDNQVVCYGDNPDPITQVTGPAGGPGSYVYQWQSSTNMAGPFVNIAANANGSEYTPPSGATYTQYYRRMVTSGMCMPVYSNVVEVLVNPRPVAFLTGGATICPGESSVIRVTMLSGTGPFTVSIANHGIVNNYTSGDDIIVTPAATTTYSLISVMDANFCEVTEPSPNLNGDAEIIVSDLPLITSFTPSPAVCEFTLASFRVTATGTNLTYQWFVDDGSGPVPASDGGTYFGSMTPTLQIFNTVREMSGYVYHVEVSGCGTTVNSVDATLTVNTAPELTLHPKDSTVCLGQDAIFEASADGTAVTWQWYVNKGVGGFVPVVNDANFSGSQTATLAVTDAQAAFNGWIFRAVASGVCGVPVNTNFAILRVINPAAVTIPPQPRTICENSSTTFIANGTGYTSLQWQVNTGSAWTDITDDATYLGAITQQLAIMNAPVSMNGYRYRLALYTICSTTYTSEAVLTVNPNPVVDFSAIDPVAACGGVPLVLNGNPAGGSGTWSQHRWTGDVGPLNSYTVQSPTFTSYITGSYNLNYRVTDSNGCTANDDLTVTVDYPSAQFTQDVEFGCTALDVTFTKDMTGIESWSWDFGDGSPLDQTNASPTHTFVNTQPGSIEYYIVKLTVKSPGGCFAEHTSMVTVYPAIDATFTPNTDIVCSGNSITFTALPGATRYFWEYGDGVSGYGTNVSSHLYVNLTTAPVVHTVRLTTTSFYNCVDTKTFGITVMPVPLPQFTADPVTQVFDPAGNEVEFTNETNDGTWNWLWRFDDNATSTDENPAHTYNDVGTYTVTLIASNAHCSDSVSHDIMIVPPAPVALFDTIPSGCGPLYININNTSLNTEVPGTTYLWDFGDGSKSTAKNPTYTYFTPGSYRVELVVTGPGGTDNYSQVVEAWPSPKAYFEITPPMVYVNDERVRAFNLSQGATSYLWDFGDGDTSKVKEPYHRYMDEGVYDITLWAYSENGCTDMYKLSPAVTVEPVGEIRFASVFTPNKTGPIERTDLPTGGTEIDQFFYPPIRQKVINYKLQIFNRLGVLIFESRDINVPWNGYYKGQLCQQGVYVWYVEGKYQDGKPFKMVGNVTLLQ